MLICIFPISILNWGYPWSLILSFPSTQVLFHVSTGRKTDSVCLCVCWCPFKGYIISQVLILHKLFFVLFWSVLKLQIKLVNTVNTTIVSHVYFLLSCYQSLIHPLKVNSDKQTDTNNHPCFSPEHSLQQQYRWSSADYMNLHFKVTNINTLQNLLWYVSCSIASYYLPIQNIDLNRIFL